MSSSVAFKCLETVDSPRFLDGRTGTRTVGLASRDGSSGTRWADPPPVPNIDFPPLPPGTPPPSAPETIPPPPAVPDPADPADRIRRRDRNVPPPD